MKEKSELAIKLKALRSQKNVSSEAVADAIGVKSATYRRYEIDTMPKTDAYIALAKYFDVSVDYLMGNSSTLTVAAPNDYDKEYDNVGELSDAEIRIIKKLRAISRDDLLDVSQYIASKKDENN